MKDRWYVICSIKYSKGTTPTNCPNGLKVLKYATVPVPSTHSIEAVITNTSF